MTDSEVAAPPSTPLEPGVYRTSWGNRWAARVWYQGKFKHLGTFKTPEEANDRTRAVRSLLTQQKGA